MEDEPMKRPPPDLGPVTLAELNERLLEVENVATIERDSGEATRFVLGNLLVRLAQMGLLDSEAFILGLRSDLVRLDPPTRLAANELLANLLCCLSPHDDAAPGATR